MYKIVFSFFGFFSLMSCGPTSQQLAFIQQVEQQCQAGDIVACHQRDGDPIEVARLEAACDYNNMQACQAVANYRTQQQNLRNQEAAAFQASMTANAQVSSPQYPAYQAPQVQPVQLSGSSNYYYCNQLGSYVITCR